jgi:predicted protein tyrosine phosphatase
MFFEEIGRNIAVASMKEAERMVEMDKGFWNVISIISPHVPPPKLLSAKRVCRLMFEDAENVDYKEARVVFARGQDLTRAFAFVAEYPNEPILVHCLAGQSRSAAVALALIYQALPDDEDRCQMAVDILLTIRTQARPNFLVLKLGLEQFLPPDQAENEAKKMLNDPRLLSNRFIR